jgi:hypothetical protein
VLVELDQQRQFPLCTQVEMTLYLVLLHQRGVGKEGILAALGFHRLLVVLAAVGLIILQGLLEIPHLHHQAKEILGAQVQLDHQISEVAAAEVQVELEAQGQVQLGALVVVELPIQ